MLDRAKRGTATPQQVFDYYLGWITDSSVTNHFQLIPDASVGVRASGWGMRVEIEDLRRVVKRAERAGRHVVVGGHSLGGTITTAYATWDFGGKPGARGLSGPRVHRRRQQPRRRSPRPTREQRLADLNAGSPWLTLRRHRRAVRGALQLHRLARRADRPELARRSARPVRLLPGEPEAAGAGHQPRRSTATRSTPRPRRRRSPPRRRTSATSRRAATRAAGTTPASSRRSSATRGCSRAGA